MARFYGCTLAVLAGIFQIKVQVDFGAKNSFFERYFNAGFYVAAASLALLPASTLATKETAKDVTQSEVAKIKVDVLALAATAKTTERVTAVAADAGVPKLIVATTLIGIF